MLSATSSDSRTTRRRRGLSRTARTKPAMAITARTKVSVRLVNSITPLIPIAWVGTYEDDVHSGQVGQPSPEPVRRTAPPVITMPTLATREASATGRRLRRDSGLDTQVIVVSWLASLVGLATARPGVSPGV